MLMRHFGGGIGHLQNSSPPADAGTEETLMETSDSVIDSSEDEEIGVANANHGNEAQVTPPDWDEEMAGSEGENGSDREESLEDSDSDSESEESSSGVSDDEGLASDSGSE